MHTQTMSQDQRRQTSTLYGLLAALVIIVMAFAMSATNAQARTIDSVTEYESALVVTELSDGSTQVNVDGEVFTVVTDEATDTIRVTDADGNVTEAALPDSSLESASPQSLESVPAQNGIKTQAKSPLLCSTLITIAEMINNFGWGLAIAVAISNPVTATAAAVVGAWGANYFWSYLRSNCY